MELLVWKGDAVSCSGLRRSYQTQGIRMRFQWKQIIPFLSEHISASESAHDRQGSRGSQWGSSHAYQRGLSSELGRVPCVPSVAGAGGGEAGEGWRGSRRWAGSCGAGWAAQSAVRTAGTRLQMEMERAGKERTRHSWSPSALILKAEGCWPQSRSEEEGG